MIKLLEPVLLLRVREKDEGIVKGMLKECENKFSKIMKDATTRDYECELRIIDGIYLTEAEGGVLGGVILYNEDKRIVCPNTLQNRMNLCFEELLPAIR
mmetsp:Transcript_64879/g.89711  ORF Transcript_64879/g.89711 Transcript_64879/m.89711 type:complete len:99 (-) Transcript_64879:173-469(-)